MNKKKRVDMGPSSISIPLLSNDPENVIIPMIFFCLGKGTIKNPSSFYY